MLWKIGGNGTRQKKGIKMNLDAFLEIESKYGLIEDQINGFHYWIYFRHVLHNELEAARAGHGEESGTFFVAAVESQDRDFVVFGKIQQDSQRET